MIDINALIPDLSRLTGLTPSALLALLIIVPKVAKAIGRAIPDDATGFAGFIRRLCAVVSVDVANRVTSGVTTDAVAREAYLTPPITGKVDGAVEPPKEP